MSLYPQVTGHRFQHASVLQAGSLRGAGKKQSEAPRCALDPAQVLALHAPSPPTRVRTVMSASSVTRRCNLAGRCRWGPASHEQASHLDEPVCTSGFGVNFFVLQAGVCSAMLLLQGVLCGGIWYGALGRNELSPACRKSAAQRPCSFLQPQMLGGTDESHP